MNAINLPITILSLALGVVRIDGTNQPGKMPPIIHVFGGQELKVDLAVESKGGDPVEIQADLYQKAQSLLAPVQKNIAVGKTPRFEDSEAVRPLISWTLTPPEVKREAEMIARLRIKTATGEWTPAGQIIMKVYPPGFAKEPLDAFAKQRGLHLFGECKRLRDFLKELKVEFDDAGADLVSLPANPDDKCVYLGEATPRELADWLAAQPSWRGKMVVFCPGSQLLPGVFVTAQGGLRIVKVTLPLLDTLSTDPSSQKTLLEILNNLTTP